MRLIPQPKRVKKLNGFWSRSRRGHIAASDDLNIAKSIQKQLPAWTLTRVPDSKRLPGAISLVNDRRHKGGPESYSLRIDLKGVEIRANCERGIFYGTQTFFQILKQHSIKLPCLQIDDEPDFPHRGQLYSIAQGRVAKLDRLYELVERLAHYKINQLHLLVQYPCTHRMYPFLSKQDSWLPDEEILKLDTFCREHYVELVPTCSGFKIAGSIAVRPEVRNLCELEVEPAKRGQRLEAGTLSPAEPGTYRFLDERFKDYLPLFSSSHVNVACDEIFDLGKGRSKQLCDRRGKGQVYVDHLKKVQRLTATQGKRSMIWGDILLEHPEIIPQLPKQAIVLNWGYRTTFKFETCKIFQKAGLDFYCCPGTSSWVSLFPRIDDSRGNIERFATMGRRTGALGFLNTDWGDEGHYNFMEYSWYGFLFGADHAWNSRANTNDFDRRFSTLFLGDDSGALGKAVRLLGHAGTKHSIGYFQGTLRHALFLPSNDAFFKKIHAKEANPIMRWVNEARPLLATAARKREGDPSEVLPYYLFAADTMLHAAKRITAFGRGGRITPAIRRRLAKEHASLKERFIALWMARSLRSEIGISLKYYDDVARVDYSKSHSKALQICR